VINIFFICSPYLRLCFKYTSKYRYCTVWRRTKKRQI
jgi:hypothetical protein